MITFKQILAGLMTAGLILGSLPVMGAGKPVKFSLKQRQQLGIKEAAPLSRRVKITQNSAEGSVAYHFSQNPEQLTPRATGEKAARKKRMQECVKRMQNKEKGKVLSKFFENDAAIKEAAKINKTRIKYDKKIREIKSYMAFSSIPTLVSSTIYFMGCINKVFPLSPIEAGLWFAINGSLSYIHYLKGGDIIDIAKEDDAKNTYGHVNGKPVTYREFLTCEGRKMKTFSYCMAGLSAVGLLASMYRNILK